MAAYIGRRALSGAGVGGSRSTSHGTNRKCLTFPVTKGSRCRTALAAIQWRARLVGVDANIPTVDAVSESRPKQKDGGVALRPHRYESDLVDEIVRNLPSLFAWSVAGTVHREVGVGRSVADVILAGPSGKASFRRTGPLTASESAIMAALRRSGPTRIDLLEAAVGVGPRTLRGESLARLVGGGAIRRRVGGVISVGPSWSGAVRIVAIEAKLVRWKQALLQASEYRRYADEAYVALPEATSASAIRHRAEFERIGVGLIIVNGSARVVVRAARSLDHDWRREFISSRLFRQVSQ